VASPGCYPTTALLGLAPAVRAGLIEPRVIVDAKSGVSGAGRGLSLDTHFSEVTESVHAYGLGGHRHQPEITQELAVLDPAASVSFVPHLVPMVRGILTTCYADLRPGVTPAMVRDAYAEAYAGEPFVRITAKPPRTKYTSGTNDCLVHPVVDERNGRLIVVSCLDNLVKGAAGQAVQAMNLMLGFDETAGLRSLALYP
jgi:N-acetyl-gamma-glutamyl-phosphate reductase